MKHICQNFHKFMRLRNCEPKDQVAVAVSGGADSLALAMATQSYFDPNSIHILTVDHRFRNESASEALHVKQILEKHNFITHKILTVNWPFKELPPINKLEVRGREARYERLLSYCQLNRINILLTAHHHFDKVETSLHRLCMGSSLDGLHGMLPDMVFTSYPDVAVLRPFLEVEKEELKLVCNEMNLKWVTDQTNFSPLFKRSTLRHVLSENKSLVTTLSEIISFSSVFCAETSAIVVEFLKDNCFLEPRHGYYYFKLSTFRELPRPIAIRVLSKLVNFFNYSQDSKRHFASKNSNVAYTKLFHSKGNSPFFKGSLEHYLIATAIPGSDKLYFGKVHTNETLKIQVGQTLNWDNRYLITLSQRDPDLPTSGTFTIRGMRRTDQTFLFRAIRRVKAAKLPLIHYRLSLPIVVTEQGQIAFMPHFGYTDFDLNVTCTCKLITHHTSIHNLPPNNRKKKRRVVSF